MYHSTSGSPVLRAGFLFFSALRAGLPTIHHAPLILVSLAAIMILAACSGDAAPVEPEVQEPPPTKIATPASAPESGAFPQTHTDVLGRRVTIESRPEAIVSLAPSVTETLFAIGAGPQVVGRTEYDNYPPEVESLPTVGGFSSSSISVETILDLEPDLVIAGARSQEEIVQALEESGIIIFVLDPVSLADIQDSVLTLGDFTGNKEGAEALIADLQQRIADVSEKVSNISPEERVTVFYEIWHEPLTTTTDETFIGELITLAGGNNIFGGLEGSYPNISAEEIRELDPDVILGPSSHSDQLTAAMIAARPGWDDLSAVKSEAIYIVDGDIISRPGPRVVDALEQIAAAFYPDLFTNS